MIAPVVESGKVAAGKVLFFVTKDGTTSTLEAGQDFKVPSGEFDMQVLSLNECLRYKDERTGECVTVQNTGGRVVLNGQTPSDLFPDLNS